MKTIEERLRELDDPTSEMPIALELSGEGKIEAEFIAYPWFDGFMRDEPVEHLAGPKDSEQQIFRRIYVFALAVCVIALLGRVQRMHSTVLF